MGLIKNRKGIFFTALALVILSLFVVSYTFYSYYQDRQVTEQRISTMSSFLFSTEQDLSRKLYISGFRTTFLLEERIVNTNQYISNLNKSFQEAFYNGTLNGQQQSLLLGTTFNDILNSENSSANQINSNIQLLSPVLTVTQSDPWNIKIILSTDLILTDNGGVAQWNKNETIVSYIPIFYFEDPLYYISTSGSEANNITQSPFTNFVSGSNIANLSSEANNQYYISSINAPSFLDRLQGISSPDQNGIESLVNLQNLGSEGISIQNKSVVDYIYFSSNNPISYSIQGMPYWFKIDNSSASLYNASSLEN